MTKMYLRKPNPFAPLNLGLDLVGDIEAMEDKFKFPEAIEKLTREQLVGFVGFRFSFIVEEVKELLAAESSDDLVDALVDICVVAIGTATCLGIDFRKAWTEVMVANFMKNAGANKSRPNPFGLPDLVKPPGWVGPNHSDNIGLLGSILSDLKEQLSEAKSDPKNDVNVGVRSVGGEEVGLDPQNPHREGEGLREGGGGQAQSLPRGCPVPNDLD